MSAKAWIIFVAVCIAVLGGLVVWSKKDNVNVSAIHQNNIQTAAASNGNIADHVYGLPNGKVKLVEYGDFECPYCGQAYPQVKSLASDYSSKITFIFRNYPISTLHPNAKAAAAAAEAAGLQGKYWEMHDKLYETQSDWQNSSIDDRTNKFISYAQEIGVKDINKFKDDLGSSRVVKKISFDQALGNKAGVSGTPTFYLNGTKVSDKVASSVISSNGSSLRSAIDALLK